MARYLDPVEGNGCDAAIEMSELLTFAHTIAEKLLSLQRG